MLYNGEVRGNVAFVHEMSKKYFNRLNAPNYRLDYTKERIFTINAVFYFKKNSELRNQFNRKLRAFSQSGIIDHWIREYTDDRKLYQKYEQKQTPQLKIQSFIAIFTICGCLLLLSIIVFVLEWYSTRYDFIKWVIDFFTY